MLDWQLRPRRRLERGRSDGRGGVGRSSLGRGGDALTQLQLETVEGAGDNPGSPRGWDGARGDDQHATRRLWGAFECKSTVYGGVESGEWRLDRDLAVTLTVQPLEGTSLRPVLVLAEAEQSELTTWSHAEFPSEVLVGLEDEIDRVVMEPGERSEIPSRQVESEDVARVVVVLLLPLDQLAAPRPLDLARRALDRLEPVRVVLRHDTALVEQHRQVAMRQMKPSVDMVGRTDNMLELCCREAVQLVLLLGVG